MKITFYSNYLTHHQLPFCERLYKELGDDFVFCANRPTAKERLDGGWDDMNEKYSFVLKKYENKENELKALELAESSDVVILGDSSNPYKEIRIKNGKFFFRETERLYKKKLNLKSYVGSLIRNWLFYRNEKNGYLLCLGAYVKKDFSSFLCYRHRALKFGYFPLFTNRDIDKIINLKQENSFIWVGRFVKWKHPEYVVSLANKLKQEGCDFKITMIGNGEMFPIIKKMIEDMGLTNNIILLSSLNYSKVASYYLSHKFHLFTSDRQEGWGAVLNESMSCGCIPIANKMIGSVPYLIKNKISGFTYKNSYSSFEKTCLKVIKMNDEKLNKIAKNGYNTIKNNWNADVAAEQIIQISKSKLSNKKIRFAKRHVCSKA